MTAGLQEVKLQSNFLPITENKVKKISQHIFIETRIQS